MAQAVSRRSVTAEARVLFWIIPCGICVDKVALGQVFLRVLLFFPQVHSTGAPLHDKTNHLHHRVAQ
jgi:hypothetical protein